MQEFQENQAPEKHLSDYLQVIRQRWKSATIVFLVIFLSITAYTFQIKPVYEAQSTLQVITNKPTLTVPWEVPNPIEAEMEIIKSRSVAEQVVDRLHLNWKISDRSKGLSFKLLDLNVKPPRRTIVVEVTGPASFSVKDREGKTLAAGTSGTLLETADVTLLLDGLKGKSGDTVTITQVPVTSAAISLKKKLLTKQIGTERNNIMSLTFQSNDPVQARDILNTITTVYVERTIAFKTMEASKSLDFLEAQMNSIKAELEASEKNLEAFKTAAGIFTLDSEAQFLFTKLGTIDQQKADLGQQRKFTEFTIDAITNARKRGTSYFTGDPVGMSITAKMEELDSQKRALLTEFTEDHPQVRSVQAQINEQLRQLLLIYQSALNGIGEKERFLAQKLGSEESGLKLLPEKERELVRLMRLSKVNSDIFTFLLQKYEEARLAKASTTGNANIIDPAITPLAPLKPDKQKNILFGLVLGLFIGIGVALFMEYLDNTIKDADTARREIGAPVMAMVPRMDADKSKEGGTRQLICVSDSKSPAAETFRGLRTSIHFSAVNKRKQVILITSSFPGEGKSTVIANLAAVYAQTGGRTLLLDADLRRPSLHTLFGAERVPGVSDILAGDVHWQAAVKQSDVSGLEYLPAGTMPPNPAELLGSGSMIELLADLRGHYDCIFVDAPPVLAVTDAPILTALTDLVLLVVEAGRVPIKAANRMAEILEAAKAPVVGIVINDKSGATMERYSYYGYRYYGDDDTRAGSWWLFGGRRRKKSKSLQSGS